MRSVKDVIMSWIVSCYTEEHFEVCREYVIKKKGLGELSAADASALLFAIQGLETSERRSVSGPPLVFKWRLQPEAASVM